MEQSLQFRAIHGHSPGRKCNKVYSFEANRAPKRIQFGKQVWEETDEIDAQFDKQEWKGRLP
jgi:hypothetical protein